MAVVIQPSGGAGDLLTAVATSPAGTIAVDASGRPTGLLQEQAQNLLDHCAVRSRSMTWRVRRPGERGLRPAGHHERRRRAGGGWIGRTPVEALAYQRPATRGGWLCVSNSWWPCGSAPVGGTDEDDLGDGIDLGLAPGSATGCASAQ